MHTFIDWILGTEPGLVKDLLLPLGSLQSMQQALWQIHRETNKSIPGGMEWIS